MKFDEDVLLYALTSRPEDARKFSMMFKPDWLDVIEYRPVLAEVYAFTKKYGESPSVVTLHKVFKDKDEDLYNIRFKEVLDRIGKVNTDNSEILYTLGQAKGVAIVRSFNEMSNDPSFLENQVTFDGSNMLNSIHKWFGSFSDTSDDRTMDIKTAIEHLINESGFEGTMTRIPCGIKPIDDWTGGGMRRKQVGIIIAPTGHGKSTVLNIMGHKIAAVERKHAWVITNELSIEETTERFLTRLSGVDLDKVMADPISAYKGLSRYWREGLDKRLRITEVNREISTDDIESEMAKWVNLHGWKPDVVIIDFMERMKPALSGYKRDKEWQWIQAIAKDLVRFAKRHNIMVWSAAQTNREGLRKDTRVDMSMTQGSIRQLQECTAVIAMKQMTPPGFDEVAIQFSNLKQRQSARSGKDIVVKCNLAKMHISNEEIDVEEMLREQMEENTIEGNHLTPLQRQRKVRKS